MVVADVLMLVSMCSKQSLVIITIVLMLMSGVPYNTLQLLC